jgi:hypothetical protein
MKVGVYLQDNSQQSGGGFTYEQEILESLLSLVETSNHTFLIFSKKTIEEKIPQNLSTHIRNEVLPKGNLFEFILLFFIQNFFPMSPFLRKLYSGISNLETRARQNNEDSE